MSVLGWSPEKRVGVELRKALNHARRTGVPTDFITLRPTTLPDRLCTTEGERICAEVRTRDGRRLFLGETGLYIERGDMFLSVPYDSITRCDWITDSDDLGVKVSQKRLHGDRLILRDDAGARHELDALGPAFQGMYNYFQWLLARPAHAATIDRLWLEHRRSAFPKSVRGQVVGGVDFVMLDADIAGCVSSFRERGTLRPQQVASLGLAYRNCNRLIPILDEDAAIYLERLERLGGLVLREIARTEESPDKPPREAQE